MSRCNIIMCAPAPPRRGVYLIEYIYIHIWYTVAAVCVQTSFRILKTPLTPPATTRSRESYLYANRSPPSCRYISTILCTKLIRRAIRVLQRKRIASDGLYIYIYTYIYLHIACLIHTTIIITYIIYRSSSIYCGGTHKSRIHRAATVQQQVIGMLQVPI